MNVMSWLLLICFLLISLSLQNSAALRPPHCRCSNQHLSLLSTSHIIDPSYDIAIATGCLSSACCVLSLKFRKQIIAEVLTVLLTFLFGYISIKTSTVRFDFDKTNLSLVKSNGAALGESPLFPSAGEKGDYSWSYESITNYCFLPSDALPLLLYFKETELPSSFIIQPPFVIDNLPGQIHIFPMIGNFQQLSDELVKHDLRKASVHEIKIQNEPTLFLNGLRLI